MSTNAGDVDDMHGGRQRSYEGVPRMHYVLPRATAGCAYHFSHVTGLDSGVLELRPSGFGFLTCRGNEVENILREHFQGG
jgi:hypothetical protein